MNLDLRKEAEQRALSSSNLFRDRGYSSFRSSSGHRIEVDELSPQKANETVRAAKLAEADYKWNGPRSRIPSGEFIPPRWIPDEETAACACKREFDFWNRRHHCRHCGGTFCGQCAQYADLLPLEFGYRDPQRTCLSCHQMLQAQQEALSSTIANCQCVTEIDYDSWRRLANLPSLSLNRAIVNAACALTQLSTSRLPDRTIPLTMLRDAKAVLFMTVVKAGWMVTGRVGSGLMISRRSPSQGGGWSAPCAVGLLGLGYGLCGGAEVSDAIIPLYTDEAITRLTQSAHLTLGLSLGLCAGLGRSAAADALVSSAGYSMMTSYAHTRGVFGGIDMSGSVLMVREEVNNRFYGRRLSAEQILGSVFPPRAAAPLYTALAEAASQLPQVHCTVSPQVSRQLYYTYSQPAVAQQGQGQGQEERQPLVKPARESKRWDAVDREMETVRGIVEGASV